MNGWLLDQNLPARLTFVPALPVQPATVLGANPTDSRLWDHAAAHRLAIVTKDTDFPGRMILQTPPPWVVHHRFGNLAAPGISCGAGARLAANRGAAASPQARERLRGSRRSHRLSQPAQSTARSLSASSTRPKANASFWLAKITGNQARDRRVNRLRRANGWKVLPIWEHELSKKNSSRLLTRLRLALGF